MTTPNASSRRAVLTAGLVLAGASGIVLLGAATDGLLASLAGFVTAISVIAAGVISWERVVVSARSEGLVEPSGV